MMIFFWVFLLVAAAVLVMTYSRRNGAAIDSFLRSKKEDPVAILKRRYAQGEIDQEEYEERKAELEKDKMFNA